MNETERILERCEAKNIFKIVVENRDGYYLKIAEAVSSASKCMKRHVGAIAVVDDAIVSTGYNGPPRGTPHCSFCFRKDISPKGDVDYLSYCLQMHDLCPAIHAEENVIINAARNGSRIKGGTLYIWGAPLACPRCIRKILNVGIERVVTQEKSYTKEEIRKYYLEAQEEIVKKHAGR